MPAPQIPGDAPGAPFESSDGEEVIRAISAGQVDAFVVSGTGEPRVVTLSSADLPYRLLTDRMVQGAVTVDADSTILYANKPFARLLCVEARRCPVRHLSKWSIKATWRCSTPYWRARDGACRRRTGIQARWDQLSRACRSGQAL